MKNIAVLDQNTIDKIAAGEVVERPAAVVKELVENAVDAGASAITVEIKEGGISFIRVTDSGSGMEKDQVPLAFLRHATSKIEKVEDLLQISSLGFRGEALSSIAAVAQVEVITKTGSAFTGVRYLIEGGMEKSLEEIGAPCGTTILVRNLFYNTPARSKFLKTPVTEAGYVSTYMEQLALSHPDISFKYMVNGQTKLHTSGNGNLKDVIYGIYGRDITKELLPLHFEAGGITLDGFIGKPVITRGNRNFENYYINGRYVKSKIITKAVEDAYKPFLMQHKYPFICFSYDISGDTVDVNVHPTKMEVRFQNQQTVYQATFDAVTQALTRREMIPEVALTKPEEKKKEEKQKTGVPEPFEQNRRAAETLIREQAPVYSPSPAVSSPSAPICRPVTPPDTSVSPAGIKPARPEPKTQLPIEKELVPAAEKPVKTLIKTEQLELFDDRLLSKKARQKHRLIGQLFDTYWLVEYDSKFYIIDQHAAHEKVLYEKFMDELKNKKVVSQMMSPPQIIALNLQEDALMKEHLRLFSEFGFEISNFGGREYSISAVPVDLYGSSVQQLFLEILDQIGAETPGKIPEFISARIATAACKAAVKGNQLLSKEEADKLIDELLNLENPYHCPHGRPTIVSMTKYELEKKFKRIV